MEYHLAQFNLAIPVSPLDSPDMTEFMNALASINTLAEQSQGFIWRLIGGDTSNSTDCTSDEYPNAILTLSVWDDVESLREFVYKSHHASYMAKRSQWFTKHESDVPYQVLWWVRKGHNPTVTEAVNKLKYLKENGATDKAFTFRSTFPRPCSTFSNEDVYNYANNGDIDNLAIALNHVQCNWFKNDRGMEAIHCAAKNNHTKCIELLIKNGANIESKTMDGSTALNWASYIGNVEIIRILCDSGANIESKCDAGESSLMKASEHGHIDCCKLLLERGANIDSKDVNGMTALHESAKSGNVDIVKLLLSNGAYIEDDIDQYQLVENDDGLIDCRSIIIEKRN